MESSENILERIAVNFADLSPSGRKIANYIQQNPLTLLSMPLSELASATHSSKATVSRLFRQLGYNSHLQAKQALLNSRNKGFPVASVSMSNQSHLDSELQNIQLTFQDFSSEHIAELGSLIANAKRVYIVGFRNAYPLALHFRQQLMQIRSNVTLLPQLHNKFDGYWTCEVGKSSRPSKHVMTKSGASVMLLNPEPEGLPSARLVVNEKGKALVVANSCDEVRLAAKAAVRFLPKAQLDLNVYDSVS